MPRTSRHAVLLGIALLPTLSSAGQRPSFRTGIDLIEVTAVVRDRDGTLIRDLTQADFQILERGIPQQIVAFDPVSIRTAPAPASASASLEVETSRRTRRSAIAECSCFFSTRCMSRRATRLRSASAPPNSSSDMLARRTWSLSCRPAVLLEMQIDDAAGVRRASSKRTAGVTVRQARPDPVVFAIDTTELPPGRYVMRIAATSGSGGDTVQRHVPFDVIVQ